MSDLIVKYTEKAIRYSEEYRVALENSKWSREIEPGDYLLEQNSDRNTNSNLNRVCYLITSVEVAPQTQYSRESQQQEVVPGEFYLKVCGKSYNPFSKQFVARWGGEVREELIEVEYHNKDIIFKSLEDLENHINLAHKFISEDLSIDEYFQIQGDNDNLPVALGSKETYLMMEKSLQQTKNKIEQVKASISLIMLSKKEELQRIKDKFESALAVMNKQIARVQRVIKTIELYIGVNEDIVQIQEGNPASEKERIRFFQEVLYMDEELGDWKDQGIDYKDIAQFDTWLCKNIDIFCSEKSVRIFRVRREEKRGLYNMFTGAYNPYARVDLKEQNAKTYIILRNGQNIYRIWADIKIHPKLFPDKGDLQNYINDVAKAEQDKWDSEIEREKQKLEDFVYQYRSNIILLQGLFDRSDVFKPCPQVNLFSEEGIEAVKEVEFVYDSEYIKLPDSKPDFWTWHANVNKTFKEGSRVIWSDKACFQDIKSRYDERYQGEHSMRPDSPDSGIYTVYTKTTDKGALCVRYNPKDTVWRGRDRWSEGERKKRLSFLVYPTDKWMIDFDQVDLEDIDFYLNSRINRKNYIEIMPLLEDIRNQLILEQQQENAFKLMLKGQYESKIARIDYFIDHYIKWWKLKNKWKRAITLDDAKAYRMITSKLDKLIK